MKLQQLITIILLFSGTFAHAKKSELPTAVILSLHPTQFAVGFNEVSAKKEEMESMTPKKLEKYLRKKAIPVVIGPNQKLYMTDHHHHASALLSMGMTSAFIEILEDWSKQPLNKFWEKMKAAGYGYLFDENGNGPLAPEQLPTDIRGLKDDPYRGLAWFVEQHGAIEEVEQAYASFAWANFFRTRVPRRTLVNNLEKAIELAIELAQSEAASDLPGFIGSKCSKSAF